MTTLRNLIVSFPATEKQISMMKSFCQGKRNCENIITLAQMINADKSFYISFMTKSPSIRFGVYSRKEKCMVYDYSLTDDQLAGALKVLNDKYAFNTTRKHPVEMDELVRAWAEHLIDRQNEKIIPLD